LNKRNRSYIDHIHLSTRYEHWCLDSCYPTCNWGYTTWSWTLDQVL